MARPNNLRIPVAALMLALLLAVAPAPASAAKVKTCANANAGPWNATAAQLRVATQCLLNNERSKRRMVRLRMNPRLTAAATQHNDDMVANNYFAHVSPRGGNVINRLLGTGYIKKALTWLVGENLAWGTEKLATPRKIVAAWMASAGHRHNILLKRYREIGVAVAFAAPTAGNHNAATYTTVFGVRK